MSDIPDIIREIFGPVKPVGMFSPIKAVDASMKVEVLATHFLETTNIYIPTNPFSKLKPGMELIKDAKLLLKVKKEAKADNDNKERSMRRSLKRAKQIIRCNTFPLFVSFTFATDRDDVDKCRRRMETWLENQKKVSRNGHFEYIIVMEYHQDGSPHFHALMSDYEGKIVPAINPHTGKQLRKKGRLVFDIPSYTLGHCEVYYVGEQDADRGKLEHYLNKLEEYLNKEEKEMPHGKKRFWYTRGLKKPVKEYNPLWFDKSIEPIWKSKTDEWGVTLIYKKEQIEQMKRNMSDV